MGLPESVMADFTGYGRLCEIESFMVYWTWTGGGAPVGGSVALGSWDQMSGAQTVLVRLVDGCFWGVTEKFNLGGS